MRALRIGLFRLLLPLALLVLLACDLRAGVAQAQPQGDLGEKNVLILYGAEPYRPLFQDTSRALTSVLESGGIPIRNQYFQTLELRRNRDPDYRKALVEEMRAQYRHRVFGLIITLFPEALSFLLDECRTLFPGVPILALYLPAEIELPQTAGRIFRHVAAVDTVGTLEIALKLVPEARRVYVVSGAHAVDRGYEEQARRVFEKWAGRLEFHYLSQLPLEEMLGVLAAAPGDAVVLMLAYTNDITGKTITTRELAQRLRQVSAAPVFGVLEVALGFGIVGGPLVSYERIGTEAGRLALDFLRGTPTLERTVPVLEVPPAPMFDWRQLKHWNLELAALPQGSIIINREYTFWEEHRSAVIGALALLGVQTLLITILVVNRVRRRRAEEELAERLKFETLLSNLSAQFVNLPADQVDLQIEDAQRRVCGCVSLDISNLWQWSAESPSAFTMTHLYRPLGGPPFPERLDAQEYFPWCLQQVISGKVVAVESMEGLPAEAARDQEVWRHYGVKAALVIPLSAGGGAPIGAMAFGTVRTERAWPEALVKRLQLVAQVLANALARKRAEEMLRESARRLTLAAASADARLWELEADTERIWMTDEGRAAFEVAPNEELTLDRVASFVHPEDRESWRQSIRQALESGQGMHAEFRVVHPDGRVRWVTSQGRPQISPGGKRSRMLGVSIDITDRKMIEERLRTSEALSGGLLSSLPGHMVIVDRSGATLRVNNAWREFAAADGASDPTVVAVGAGLRETRPKVDGEPDGRLGVILGGIAAVLAGRQSEFHLEYPHPTSLGERWFSVNVLPLRRPEGGAVIYHQDITEQQRSRLETERLRGELAHVGRVTTMGEMAAALAHELNQPLTAILSNAHAGERYLAQPAPPLGEIREILEDVTGDARRASDVIQRLRSLLRKEDARLLVLDMKQVIREVAGLVRTDAILRNLGVDLDLAVELPPVRGDRVQLQQVLLNLVLNAMEAMGAHAEGQRVVVEAARTGEAVRVAVRDEGPGIPADTLPCIFEPFYTTKPSGMGMGLAISRSIVEAHGGRIGAENNPDRGATFWFTLPVCPPEPTTA